MTKPNNPLLNVTSDMDFSAVQPEHIKEAIEYYIKESEANVDKMVLIENPTWDNVYKDFENLDIDFSRAMSLIGHIKGVKNQKEIEEVYEECIPLLIKHSNKVNQDKRLLTLYKKLELLDLSEMQQTILSRSLKGFTDSGIDLSEENKKKYNHISEQISTLSNKFSNNTLESVDNWTLQIDNKEDLEGVPESLLEMFKMENSESYLLTLKQPYISEIMKSLKNRDLRKTLSEASSTIASEFMQEGKYDNEPILKELVLLKNEKAKLVGYENYVEYSLSNKMANSLEEVNDLLYSLKDKSRDKGFADLQLLKDFAFEKDGIEDFSQYDNAYYQELYKAEKFNIDSEEIKKYFPIEKVKNGLFWLIEELYDVKFKKDSLSNLYDESVEYYSLYRGEEKIASVLMDLYARDKKRGGAWMSDYQGKFNYKETNNLPVAFVVCNFSQPTEKIPSLLNFNQVETFFHEFGHALHHLLTTIDEPSASGINGVVWDAVELPSQFMEYFCMEKEVLNKISGHYETGEVLSEELLSQIKSDKNFMTSLGLLRQLEFSIADLKIYGSPEKCPYDVLNSVREEVAVLKSGKNNRFLNAFSHIFAGGYSAGYYGYKWADVLSADVFETFEENGVICKKTANKFLETILSKGGSKDINKMFLEFKGRKPTADALLKYSGI
jgi:oligopeptidase A